MVCVMLLDPPSGQYLSLVGFSVLVKFFRALPIGWDKYSQQEPLPLLFPSGASSNAVVVRIR
jgi:hypothetical protein